MVQYDENRMPSDKYFDDMKDHDEEGADGMNMEGGAAAAQMFQ